MPRAQIIAMIKEFFGFVGEREVEFRSEWARLGKAGRDDFIHAFATGSLTY